jgi:hypothetical protein
MQHWVFVMLLVMSGASSAPMADACSTVTHQPDSDVGHRPDGGVAADSLDPATAALVDEASVLVRRPQPASGVEVEVRIPPATVNAASRSCPAGSVTP